jgi:hypothetical protein
LPIKNRTDIKNVKVGLVTKVRFGQQPIDWELLLIRLPKEATKERKPKSIPINHHVQAVLDKLPRTIHDYVITYKGRLMTGKNN